MDRRAYLSVVVTAAVAGCQSGDEDGSTGDSDGESSDAGEAETDTSTPGPQPPTLDSHEIEPMVGGYEMTVTMTNNSEEVMNRAVGEVAVYDGDTRLTTGRAAIIDLEPGITATESALLEDIPIGDVTRYTITMQGELEDYTETETTKHEFDGEEFRERLPK